VRIKICLKSRQETDNFSPNIDRVFGILLGDLTGLIAIYRRVKLSKIGNVCQARRRSIKVYSTMAKPDRQCNRRELLPHEDSV
jgi:hypothetical protein